ncbi:MAG: hypothetical protein HQL93_09425, partial [Magnetococcales bacterium]|nr:hypothetical protein [Magnetococcales bacterium]
QELLRREGSFRNFLDDTIPTTIEKSVLEARREAEKDVRSYLQSLQNAHWATLRASVRRGGTFYGSRAINLPEDIVSRFQEPMAAVWGDKLLKVIRSKTAEHSNDIATIVEEICIWASENSDPQNNAPMEYQKTRIARHAEQMKQIGKESADKLREIVKIRLMEVIRLPIKDKCEQFVRSGDDVGHGVKVRIMNLFNQLAEEATEAAKQPAIDVLQGNFNTVRLEIHKAFKQWGNPIEDTKDLIINRHDRQMRDEALLADLEDVRAKCPVPWTTSNP